MFSVETVRAYLLNAPELNAVLFSFGIKQNNEQKAIKQFDTDIYKTGFKQEWKKQHADSLSIE